MKSLDRASKNLKKHLKALYCQPKTGKLSKDVVATGKVVLKDLERLVDELDKLLKKKAE